MHRNGEDLNLGDYDCRTCLHLAACSGQEEVVAWLLDVAGCDAKPRDRWGVTPLEEARKYGHTFVAERISSFAGSK